MEEIFGIKSDINSVIKMTEGFLYMLKDMEKKNTGLVLNPNYVGLLDKLFKSPDVMLFSKGG